MNSKNEILNKLDEIREVVEQKELLETQVSILEQILVTNNIFTIVFDENFHIRYQNFPSSQNPKHLHEFSFLIGRENLQRIQTHIQKRAKELEDIKFYRKTLFFNVKAIQDKVWYIQINKMEMEGEKQTNLEENQILDEISGDFEEFYKLTETLEDIRKLTLNHSYDNIAEKIQELYLPQISEIQEKIEDPVLQLCLDIIKQSITEVLGPEIESNQEIYSLLTPSEIQIAKFVRMGKTTKEIANILSIARKTVDNHRNNLRSKLGIANKSINLQTYLSTLNEHSK